MLPKKTAALGEKVSQSTLKTLAEIVQGNPLICGKYTGKIQRGRTDAPWYYPSGAKSSYNAARFFTDHGNATNLTAAVQSGLATLEDLESFLQRTPLTECNKGRVENAIRRLQAMEVAAKATEAAEFSGGNGATGELSAMIAAETEGGQVPLTDAIPAATTRRQRRFAGSRQ